MIEFVVGYLFSHLENRHLSTIILNVKLFVIRHFRYKTFRNTKDFMPRKHKLLFFMFSISHQTHLINDYHTFFAISFRILQPKVVTLTLALQHLFFQSSNRCVRTYGTIVINF